MAENYRLLNFMPVADQPTIFTPHSRAALEATFDVVDADREMAQDPQGLASQLAAVNPHVILTGWRTEPVRITDAALNAAPAVRVWAHFGSTLKKVFDAPEHLEHLRLINTARIIARYVAESTLGHMIYGMRRIREMNAACRLDEHWGHANDPAREISLYQAKVGLIGLGCVGREVLRVLTPFSPQVRVYDPYLTSARASELGVTGVELDELLSTCDVISLHAPAIPQTHHMIDQAALAKMHDGAGLINTARGSLVDAPALAKEIESGRLWAVCDVLEGERRESVEANPLYGLGDRPNFILTPHIAGIVPSARGPMLEELIVEAARTLKSGDHSSFEASRDALIMG